MAKTKKVNAERVISSKPKSHDNDCWLCWLFKVMILLFIAMVIFWLGFCFGAFSAWPPTANNGLSTGQVISPLPAVRQNQLFDKDFLEQMIIHHQEAITMARLALTKTGDENIKTLCQSIINTQTQEIERLKAWVETLPIN